MKKLFVGSFVLLCSLSNLFATECNLHAYIPISMTRSELPQFNYGQGGGYADGYKKAIDKLILNVVSKTGCRLVGISKENPADIHEALNAYNNRIENMAEAMVRHRANYGVIVSADLYYKEYAQQASGMAAFMQLVSLDDTRLNYSVSAHTNFSFLSNGESYKMMQRHLDKALLKLSKKFNRNAKKIETLIHSADSDAYEQGYSEGYSPEYSNVNLN